MNENTALTDGFLRSVREFGCRPAIQVCSEVLTLSELLEAAHGLTAIIDGRRTGREPPLTAVFAYRSVTAFVGVLGSLLCGHGYVPLNRTFPPERTRTMLLRSDCRTLVVDAESETLLNQILDGIDY